MPDPTTDPTTPPTTDPTPPTGDPGDAIFTTLTNDLTDIRAKFTDFTSKNTEWLADVAAVDAAKAKASASGAAKDAAHVALAAAIGKEEQDLQEILGQVTPSTAPTVPDVVIPPPTQVG